jgi:hypothetical protein
MDRPDTTSRGSSSAVGVEFNTVLFRLCSVGQLMECVSRADAWINDACGSGRKDQEFSEALAFVQRQRVVTQLDPRYVAHMNLQR